MAKPTEKFIQSTIGLNACHLASTGSNAAPKMTRIEIYAAGQDAYVLVPVSGHNLAEKPGRTTISRGQFEALDDRTTTKVEFAQALMALCGYEA